MLKRVNINWMVLLFLLDHLVVQVVLPLAVDLRYALPIGQFIEREWIYLGWALRGIIALAWTGSFVTLGVYNPRQVTHWIDEVQRVVMGHAVAALLMAGMLYLVKQEMPRLAFGYFFVLSLAVLLIYRGTLRAWQNRQGRAVTAQVRVLIVGAGSVGRNVAAELTSKQWPELRLLGFLDDDPAKRDLTTGDLPILGTLADASRLVADLKVDEVLIALPLRAHQRFVDLVATLQEHAVRVRVVPDYFELAFFGATVESLAGIPLIGLRDPAIDGFQRFVKRLLDLAVAGISLILTFPLLLAVAAAIKLEDGGPIFYRSPRMGENGAEFDMLKFRTMRVGADKELALYNQVDEAGNVLHKRPDDPRVTRVGGLLRRTSLDELPQLLNVLRGDMSMVGPRPELPWLVEKYSPWQRKRFSVPQGITGWWQINGRSDRPLHLHTEDDLYYIQNYSLWLDLLILWRTLPVVIRRRGAF